MMNNAVAAGGPGEILNYKLQVINANPLRCSLSIISNEQMPGTTMYKCRSKLPRTAAVMAGRNGLFLVTFLGQQKSNL